jgi:hypothetical protein
MRRQIMSDTILAVVVAAVVAGIGAVRDVLSLWIRARYKWGNGHRATPGEEHRLDQS